MVDRNSQRIKMPINKSRFFLVCYDIANPKRLVRVHRYLKKRGMPLQYSVFLVLETSSSLIEVLAQIDEIINSREDDIRAYPINDTAEYTTLGQQALPAGLLLLGDGMLGV